jgi:hypothetical protein
MTLNNRETVQFRYVFANTGYLVRQIKLVLKDVERGAFSREQGAVAIRALAGKLELKASVHPELPIEEANERVKQHLADRNMI